MKKYIVLLLLIITTSLGLCGCTAKELDIEYVEAELQYSTITKDTYGTDIENIVFESRETDKEGGIDICSFLVQSSNEYIRRTDRIDVIYRLGEDKKSWNFQCFEIDNDFETAIEVLLEVEDEDIFCQVKEMPSYPLKDMECVYSVSNIEYNGLQAIVDIKITTDIQNTMLIGEGSIRAICKFIMYNNSWKVTALENIDVANIKYDIEGTWSIIDNSGFARSISGIISIYNYDAISKTFDAYVSIDDIDQSWIGSVSKISGEVPGNISFDNYYQQPMVSISGELLRKTTSKDGNTTSTLKEYYYRIPIGKKVESYEDSFKVYSKISNDVESLDDLLRDSMYSPYSEEDIQKAMPRLLDMYAEFINMSPDEIKADLEGWLDSPLEYSDNTVIEYAVADTMALPNPDIIIFYDSFCFLTNGEFYVDQIVADNIYIVYPNRFFYATSETEYGTETISKYTINNERLYEEVLLSKNGAAYFDGEGNEITMEYYNGLKDMYLSSGTLVSKAKLGDLSLLDELR